MFILKWRFICRSRRVCLSALMYAVQPQKNLKLGATTEFRATQSQRM